MSTSKRTSNYHHGDLRDAMIRAGLEILAEGVDQSAISLREAARRAGVSAMAPYRHFADKDALLAAIAAVGFGRLADDLQAADGSSTDPAAALVAQGVAYVAFACAHPSLFRLMFGTALPKSHSDLAETGNNAFSVLASRVGSMSSPEAASDQAIGLWAVAHGLASLAIDGRLAQIGEHPVTLSARVLKLFKVSPSPT